MNEFARVLHDIIRQGKQQKAFTIKNLAEQAGMAASYLSNLKQGNQNPPAHTTFGELCQALRHFGVSETDLQRLTDAYTRTLLGAQPAGSFLETLQQEARHKREEVGARIQRALHPTPADWQIQYGPSGQGQPGIGLEEGNRSVLVQAMLRLLDDARERGLTGGRMYLTWFHTAPDDETEPLHAELRQALHAFLKVDSYFSLYHLWGGDAASDLSVITNFLFGYLGTSNCYLYQIAESKRLPDYFVIEGLGFIEARPTLAGRYWIRRVQVQEPGDRDWQELQAVRAYLEFLLGPEDTRQPVMQTEASLQLYTEKAALKNLAEAEQQAAKDERFLIKPTFSDLYGSVEAWRARLQALNIPPHESDAFLTNHNRRLQAFRQRLEQGKEYTIHEGPILKKVFRQVLAGGITNTAEPAAFAQGAAQFVQAQLREVLSVLRQHPQIHFALSDREFPFQIALAGGKAVFAFDTPDFPERESLKDEIQVMAWTNHPDVVYRLRKECEGVWKSLDPDWRTDTEAGRRNVVNFLVAESIKALVQANTPTRELWAMIRELTNHAPQFNGEAFRREQFIQEQGAQEIVIVSPTFPCITMPVEVGPWTSRSLIRTRQSLFDAILKRVKQLHVITAQSGIDRYWNASQYGQHIFAREWIERHFRAVHAVLKTAAEAFTMEIAPPPEDCPGYVEIINRESVFLSNDETQEEIGGLVLHDQELAHDLLAYVERHLSAACTDAMKGAENVATWLEGNYLQNDRNSDKQELELQEKR